MRTDDFDYELPPELIAQEPAEPRDSCRLLVLHREDGSIEHRQFTDIVDYLDAGDLVVANRTRVLPARLVGRKPTGGLAEALLLRRREDLDALGSVWECLVSPGRRLRQGARIEFRAGGALAPEGAPTVLEAEVLDFLEGSRGGRLVRFEPRGGLSLDASVHAVGNVPLPPYIQGYEGDPEKYQTVYAMDEEHSAAAPTAGLHFTPALIERLRAKGVSWESVELEVGIDTFRLVEEDDPADHVIHTERYHVPPAVVEAVHAAKGRGGKVVAIGTTSVRSLESAYDPLAPASCPPMVARRFEGVPDSSSVMGRGDLVAREDATTNLYLMPGSTFHVVDALVTNFHVPRSTLMMLVSAFATREQVMDAYREAIERRYRFFSFGDAMLII